MFGNHGLCGLLEEGAHEKSPKCLGGNLGDFGEFCKGLIRCIGRRNGCGCHVSPAIFRFQFRPDGARIIRYITAGPLCRRIRRRFVRTSVIADFPLLLRIVVPVVSADGIIAMRRVFRSLSRDVLPCRITARLIPLSGFLSIPIYLLAGGRAVSTSALNRRFWLVQRASL